MVGNTGRKCSSQGINVIWGGSQCMGNPYKPLLSPKSIKIDRRIQLIVSKSTHEPNIWGLVVVRKTDIIFSIDSRDQSFSPCSVSAVIFSQVLQQHLFLCGYTNAIGGQRTDNDD